MHIIYVKSAAKKLSVNVRNLTGMKQFSDNKSLAIKNSRNGGRRMRCPACRKEVVLDMHGVHSLPRNSGAEKMIASIEKWHKDVREGNEIKKKQPKKRKYIIPNCPVKDHYNQKLNIYCRSCQVLTCTLCKVIGLLSKFLFD